MITLVVTQLESKRLMKTYLMKKRKKKKNKLIAAQDQIKSIMIECQ
jgi:hypothetical protein